MKKIVKILALSVLGLVIVAGVLVWMEFGALIKGANSCVKLDDGMYYMEYKGDDGFKELMDCGGCNESVAVEYVDNQMVVTESPFVPNHYLCEEKFLVGLHEGDHRHEKLMEQYDAAGGVMNADQLTETIASVAQLPEKGAIVGGTLWTMVMDLSHPSVTYYSLRHFDKPFHFELGR